MKFRAQIIQTSLAWGLTGIFLMLFNPARLPVVVFIIPFLLLFAAFYFSWELVRYLRIAYFGHDGSVHRHLGVVVSASAVVLLVLQSLGQLSLRDVLTLGAIIVLGYVYLGRTGLKLPTR